MVYDTTHSFLRNPWEKWGLPLSKEPRQTSTVTLLPLKRGIKTGRRGFVIKKVLCFPGLLYDYLNYLMSVFLPLVSYTNTFTLVHQKTHFLKSEETSDLTTLSRVNR